MQASIKLIVEVIKDNEVIKKIEKDNDLITKQTFKLIYDLLVSKPEVSGYIDHGGNYHDVWLVHSPTKVIDAIAIGTGRTLQNFNDVKLENQIAEAGISIQNYTEDIQNNQIYFDVVASFNISNDTTIYEFGLLGRILDYWDWNEYRYLACRDVISDGVFVPAGSTLNVTYRVTLSQ
ncbi:MAG: hypothetical protein QW047_08835 [Sulfolobales archaeon]